MGNKSRKEYNRKYYLEHSTHINESKRRRRNRPEREVYQRELEYYKTNLKRFKHNYLLRTYGITYESYNNIFELQKGCCAICGTHQSELKKSLSVDHNHETKKIRGLLCQKCNTGLGNFGDSLEMLDKAREFLINNDK